MLDELCERLLDEFEDRFELELLDEFEEELPTNTSLASSPVDTADAGAGAGPWTSTRPIRGAGSLAAADATPPAASTAAIMPPARSVNFFIRSLPLSGTLRNETSLPPWR
ncbi:hypothetical protein U91I_04075 [alpha proteobacterium U9-1i]|nr:hypothetical protein U91I_04075 [alpha proteobacterium U9-1i]